MENLKSYIADVVLEVVDSFCGHFGSNEKERSDVKLENARMKQEITDMK